MALLDQSQVSAFRDRGFLVTEIPGLTASLAPVVKEYEALLGDLVQQLVAERRLCPSFSSSSFEEGLTAIHLKTGDTFAEYFAISLPPEGVTEATPLRTGPAIFRLLRHPGILDAVESLISSEISVTPILYVRLKPPEGHRAGTSPKLCSTPPHQDNSGLPPEADGTQMITVWLPLQDTHVGNGCLQVWPASHRLGVLPHQVGADSTTVPEEQLAQVGDPVAVPVQRGSVLLMHRRLVHASLPNLSTQVRWSFDLRYQPTGQPPVRPFYPSFVARSRSKPETEARDPAKWSRAWREARTRAAAEGTPSFHRFS